MTEEPKCVTCGENPANVVWMDVPQGIACADMAKRPPVKRKFHLPCDECDSQADAKWEAAKRAEQQAEWLAKFEAVIPPRYQESDPARFPGAWRTVKQWQPTDEKGLILIGETGRCKSRMLCRLARRLFVKNNIRVGYVTASDLAKTVRRQWSSNPRSSVEAEKALNDLQTVSVLILDDLGKQSNSPAVEEAVFDLFEHRTSHIKPTLVAANMNGQEMASHMSADRGIPLIRRIREFCTPIEIS